MFNNYYRPLSLAGIDSAKLSSKELRSLVRQILDAKIHGISFSPYVEGQGPGTLLGEEQIRERLAVIRPHAHWIRTFSCTQGNELIPGFAAESGLKTMVGVWLGDDYNQNETELANAIDIARAGRADILLKHNYLRVGI